MAASGHGGRGAWGPLKRDIFFSCTWNIFYGMNLFYTTFKYIFCTFCYLVLTTVLYDNQG